ncbi:MAG: molecular chaperone HtpG [Ruminococcaceae bacterium]|nr:molecular chaperone HtpG [Oscillospiraceae bacterium]
MKKKQFKTESQKLLDMMINSIYTHEEIFLRELISNASDAIDKLYFRSLTDSDVSVGKGDYAIWISADKDARTLTISDNGCGMSKDELENNLGTIAKSGSFDFKRENNQGESVDIIGQFGVGFYSAFMVADKITVRTKQYGENEASIWESTGVDGYRIGDCDKNSFGTEIVLHIKEDSDDEKYSDFLEEYKIRSLVKKYSDYIRYPIKMTVTRSEKKEGTENEYENVSKVEILNSMIPLWKKAQSEVTDEEYNNFYSEKYYDFEAPLKVITQKSEGTATYTALMFIPSHAPYNYYTKDYEKGLELYSSGVMIMEKCSDLLPDYFSFVKGLVDSSDLSLNISRELLQHDRQLKVMAKSIEKKIKSELEKLLKQDREKYEKFFDAFGIQLKFGLYSDYGMHKDTLQDLVMFKSSKEGKYVTLKEYISSMKEEQKAIYYACGESVERIEMLPQVESVKEKGYEVLYLTDDVDEFALKMLGKYDDKEFKNVTTEALDISTDEEKEAIKKENESAEEMLKLMKESIEKVSAVKFTNTLKKHPVCLTSEGDLSVEMEKVLKRMPGAEEGAPTATVVLEINSAHPIANKLKALYEEDKEKLAKYAKILYSEACLISGVGIDNPVELTELISELMI